MADEHPENMGGEHGQLVQALATQGPQVRVELNASQLATLYSNLFRVSGTYEELLIDFGLHTGILAPSGPEPVKLSQRIVMSFPTAKRLLAALQLAIARHEQLFGVIETEPHKRAKPK